jgi:hypothetical protein
MRDFVSLLLVFNFAIPLTLQLTKPLILFQGLETYPHLPLSHTRNAPHYKIIFLSIRISYLQESPVKSEHPT